MPLTRQRVVDINALRGLAPLPRAPRPQAITPPAPHAAPPLEPQAQRPRVFEALSGLAPDRDGDASPTEPSVPILGPRAQALLRGE